MPNPRNDNFPARGESHCRRRASSRSPARSRSASHDARAPAQCETPSACTASTNGRARTPESTSPPARLATPIHPVAPSTLKRTRSPGCQSAAQTRSRTRRGIASSASAIAVIVTIDESAPRSQRTSAIVPTVAASSDPPPPIAKKSARLASCARTGRGQVDQCRRDTRAGRVMTERRHAVAVQHAHMPRRSRADLDAPASEPAARRRP